jgi:hypothetical protein
MGKSAQVIDGKGVASVPLRKRVQDDMKTNGIREQGTGSLQGLSIERCEEEKKSSGRGAKGDREKERGRGERAWGTRIAMNRVLN